MIVVVVAVVVVVVVIIFRSMMFAGQSVKVVIACIRFTSF